MTAHTSALTDADSAQLGSVARNRVAPWLTDFETLDRLFPGAYPRVIVRGEGAYLYDSAGGRYLDGAAHLGACQIGHARAEMAERIADQVRVLEFTSMEVGHVNAPAAQLAGRLAELLPIDDPVMVFSSTGSEANECAFRIARLYQALSGQPGRVKILARDGSYHGSTFGALSATGVARLRDPFAPLVPGFIHTSQPSPGRCGFCTQNSGCTLECADDVERVIEAEGPETVAAFIGEPVAIMQAVKVPHNGYWQRIREICDRHGVLLILDEVVNGFGRTGKLFGSEHWGVRPDIMTMAKGLTSGYVPLSITAVTREIHEVVEGKAVYNMNTYAGHPVACAAALANLEILEREQLVARAAQLEPVLAAGLDRVRAIDERVFRATAIGLLGCVEVSFEDPTTAAEAVLRIRTDCFERGLLMRGASFGSSGDVIASFFLYPPLVVDEQALADACDTIGVAIEAELSRT